MTEQNSSSGWGPGTRIRCIRMHREVFNAYVEVYHSACIMAEKMDEVLEHYEHQRLISTGVLHGYKMPNVEAVSARNSILKLYLEGLDLYRDAHERNGAIEIPAKTARQMHMVARQADLIFADVINNINGSDYMLWIRNLKKMGGAYQGPTSLQEVFNLWVAVINTSLYVKKHVPEEQTLRLEHWKRYVL